MDGSRFDELTRALAAPGSRRRLLGGIAAGAVAALGLGRAEAAKRGRPAGSVCRKDGDCAEGTGCLPGDYGRNYCTPLCGTDGAVCCAGNVCGDGLSCDTATNTCAPCGQSGTLCCAGNVCGEGLSCDAGTCTPNVCAHTCVAADNFCNVPPANQCCGGSSSCRCMTTNSGPFCFGGAGYGGCEGTTAQGKTVPHCEVDADCEAVFGADSGVQCIAASTFPAGSSCCPGGTQSACILPCPTA